MTASVVIALIACSSGASLRDVPGNISEQVPARPAKNGTDAAVDRNKAPPASHPARDRHSRDGEPSNDTEPRDLVLLRAELTSRFEKLLADPDDYAQRVRRECRRYPEGDLFPFTFPAMAYARLAQAGQVDRESALQRTAPLLEQAIAATEAKVRPPGGRLQALTDTRHHGVYLGQLALALTAWQRAGGDDRWQPLTRHLAQLLANEIESANGVALDSFPHYRWTFDTIPALVAVARYERHTGEDLNADQLIEAHLAWLAQSATDDATELPFSRISARSGRPQDSVEPRGCELSWRVTLLAEVAPERARRLYDRYVEAFWIDRGIIAGFAEWPGGRPGRADLDSGPIFQGIGATASTVGIGAAIAVGDRERLRRLLQQATLARGLLTSGALDTHLRRGGGRRLVATDECYFTGFLYGDATLFYAVTRDDFTRYSAKTATR